MQMDLTSPRVIKDICAKFGFTFKKGLGQNFITSKAVLSEIADAADAQNGVIEIGPGFGSLTAALADRGGRVIALEIDSRLIDVLSFTLSGYDNVKIINADVMKTNIRELIENEFNGSKVSVAANLPYYITTPVITMLLEEKLPLSRIVVMVQKEVANRITAAAGTKDYGALTVLCRYYTEPSVIANVSASQFFPPPKVDSAVLSLKLLDKPSVDALDEKIFFRTVKSAFSQRRKTLLNCLSASFSIPKDEIRSLLEIIGIDPSRRGETLTPGEFALVSNNIKGVKYGSTDNG